MAKMFYSLEEACDKLNMSEDQIKALVRQAKLREFRDAGKVNYKIEEVDALVADVAADSSPESGSGELVLEPAEESTIDLAMGSTGDMLSLEEADADETATGEETEEKKKDDTVVTSVGISVFDEDEEIEGVADPLAQTVVSGASAGGLGIEGVGSGSGLLDLTRESDDTSLGAELLDEIYPGEQEDGAEMGEATRAGLEEAIDKTPKGEDLFEGSGVSEAVPSDHCSDTGRVRPRCVGHRADRVTGGGRRRDGLFRAGDSGQRSRRVAPHDYVRLREAVDVRRGCTGGRRDRHGRRVSLGEAQRGVIGTTEARETTAGGSGGRGRDTKRRIFARLRSGKGTGEQRARTRFAIMVGVQVRDRGSHRGRLEV